MVDDAASPREREQAEFTFSKRQSPPWFAQAEKTYLEFHKARPADYPVPTTERIVLGFINAEMYKRRTMDVIASQRTLEQKVVSLVAYINHGVRRQRVDLDALDAMFRRRTPAAEAPKECDCGVWVRMSGGCDCGDRTASQSGLR